jgi:hypothetical protein
VSSGYISEHIAVTNEAMTIEYLGAENAALSLELKSLRGVE